MMVATDFKDYYSVLGVSRGANADEIKKSFRRLARKYHPDMNPGNQQAEARFKEVNEAYEVLSDPEKRKKYDQFGQYWKQAGTSSGYGRGTAPGVDFNGFDFSQYTTFDDFINELLGRMGTGSPGASTGRKTSYNYRSTGRSTGFGGFEDFASYGSAPKNSTVPQEASIVLSLAEAFHGVQKRINLGSEVIEVRIPPGAKPGTRIRVRGKGSINPQTQQRADLYLTVSLQSHSFFEFEGDNLVCELPISPEEAVLGASIEVPTPDGRVQMSIPAGIRHGQSLRLRGKGWPNPKGSRGDQLVKIAIAVPKTLSKTERECYEKLKTLRTNNPRANLSSVRL
nr:MULTISPECIES: DnaJ C-terminal domain-containing protein [unclassified Roseofilum]